jgi:hypothetical protein
MADQVKGGADLQVRPREGSRFADDKDDVVEKLAEGQDLKRLIGFFHQLLLKAVVVRAARHRIFGSQDQSVLFAERYRSRRASCLYLASGERR